MELNKFIKSCVWWLEKEEALIYDVGDFFQTYAEHVSLGYRLWKISPHNALPWHSLILGAEIGS